MPKIIQANEGKCPCATKHVPAPKVLMVLDRPDGSVVPLCPTAKINLDHLLKAYVQVGGTPVGSVTKHYGRLIRTLAKEVYFSAPNEGNSYVGSS